MTDDGVVIVLDFTGRDTDDAARDHLSFSQRRTTSSRTPGRVNEGTVITFTRKLIECPFCKGRRLDFDGPHGTRVVGVGQVRDCAGRTWTNGVLKKGETKP